MTDRLEGKSYIVTGGASGIGRAAVQLICEAGGNVTIADRNDAAADVLLEQVAATRGDAQFIRTDVSDEASVVAMVAAAIGRYGALAGAINSAGIPPRGHSLHELPVQDWDLVMTVNLRGMFLSLKHEIAALLQGGGGAIVAVSSAAAVIANPYGAEYSASKSGINGMVRTAAIEYADEGIRINAIMPGATDTPLVVEAMKLNPRIAGRMPIPMQRMADPREVAAGAVWLLTDDASYMTGCCMSIDGGMTIA